MWGPKPTIRLTLLVENVPTPADAFVIAKDYAKKVLARLAFHFSISLDDPHVGHLDLEKEYQGKTQWTAQTALSLGVAGHQNLSLDDGQMSKLRTDLGAESLSSDVKYQLLMEATRSDDTTEQFMCLYALLYDWHGGTQANLDQFVINNDPDPRPLQSPVRSQSHQQPNDTIYTRLRNVIGHYQSGMSLESTRQEMEQRLPGLMRLARLTIDPSVGSPSVVPPSSA